MRTAARFLTGPVGCLLCAALLLLDWSSLPADDVARSEAARYRPFPRLIQVPRYPSRDRCPDAPPGVEASPADPGHAAAHIAGGASLLFFMSRPPSGLVATNAVGAVALPQDGPVLGTIAIQIADRPRYRGLWAPTSEVTELHAGRSADWAAPADRARLAQAIFDAAAPPRSDERRQPAVCWLRHAARATNTVTTPYGDRSGILAVSSSPLISGYLHNTAALTAAGLLTAGVVRGMRRGYRRWIRRSRRARGLCPACGYDLRGEFEVGCPECGWNRRGS